MSPKTGLLCNLCRGYLASQLLLDWKIDSTIIQSNLLDRIFVLGTNTENMTERHHQVNRWLNPIHFKQSSTFWQTIGESRGPAVAIHVSLSTMMVGSLQSGRPDKISIHHFKNAACPSAVTWDRLAHLWTNNPPVWPISWVLGLPCSRIFLASQNHYSQTSFQNPESKMQQRRVQWTKDTTHRRWNAQLKVQGRYSEHAYVRSFL